MDNSRVSCLSVIIRVYNRFDFLPQAIESILNQSYKPIEICIIDDGSTKDISPVVNQFKNQDIRVVRIDHQGRSAALNAGIWEAGGEYLLVLDDDDLIDLKMISKCMDVAKRTRADIVTVNYQFFIGKMPGFSNGEVVSTKADDLVQYLVSGNFLSPSSVIFKKDLAQKTNVHDAKFEPCEDLNLWMSMLLTKPHVEHVDECLSFVRVHDTNISANDAHVQQGRLRVFENLEQNLENDIKEKYKISQVIMVRLITTGWYMILERKKKEGRQLLLRAGLKKFLIWPLALVLWVSSFLSAGFLRWLTFKVETLSNRRNRYRELQMKNEAASIS